jgi:hypothetical protein
LLVKPGEVNDAVEADANASDEPKQKKLKLNKKK